MITAVVISVALVISLALDHPLLLVSGLSARGRVDEIAERAQMVVREVTG